MKNIVFIILFTIVLFNPVVAWCQTPTATPGEQVTVVYAQLSKVYQDMIVLKPEADWIVAQKPLLESQNALLIEEVKKSDAATTLILARNTAWNVENNPHDDLTTETNAYNVQCDASGDSNFVKSCNKWKAKLDARRAVVMAKRAQLQADTTNNDLAVAALNAGTDKNAKQFQEWTTRYEAYRTDLDNFGAKYNVIVDKMTPLVKVYDDCAAAHTNDADATKQACGIIQYAGKPLTPEQIVMMHQALAPAWRK